MSPIRVLLASCLLLPGVGFGCGEPAGAGDLGMEIEPYRVTIPGGVDAARVNAEFDAVVVVCDADGRPFSGELRFDAFMPGHGHGMNYHPLVEMIAPGRFRISGILLHMPGEWEYRIGLEADGEVRRGRAMVPIR